MYILTIRPAHMDQDVAVLNGGVLYNIVSSIQLCTHFSVPPRNSTSVVKQTNK